MNRFEFDCFCHPSFEPFVVTINGIILILVVRAFAHSLVFIVSFFSWNNDASTQSNRAHICALNPSSKQKLVSTWYFKLEIEKKKTRLLSYAIVFVQCNVWSTLTFGNLLAVSDSSSRWFFQWTTNFRWKWYQQPISYSLLSNHLTDVQRGEKKKRSQLNFAVKVWRDNSSLSSFYFMPIGFYESIAVFLK